MAINYTIFLVHRKFTFKIGMRSRAGSCLLFRSVSRRGYYASCAFKNNAEIGQTCKVLRRGSTLRTEGDYSCSMFINRSGDRLGSAPPRHTLRGRDNNICSEYRAASLLLPTKANPSFGQVLLSPWPLSGQLPARLRSPRRFWRVSNQKDTLELGVVE